MALANLASGVARAAAVAAGAVATCVDAAQHPTDGELRRYAAVALLNLAAAGRASGGVLVAHGALPPLLHLCQSATDVHASRAALKALLNLAANPSLVPPALRRHSHTPTGSLFSRGAFAARHYSALLKLHL
jgi:hypothetical protein